MVFEVKAFAELLFPFYLTVVNLLCNLKDFTNESTKSYIPIYLQAKRNTYQYQLNVKHLAVIITSK